MKKTGNITEMTSGSPFLHIMKFTLPLLIGNLFQQLYNMTDSIVVGNAVGKNALASVGCCASSTFLFFSLCAGMSIGIGVMVSQYFGAKEEGKVRSTISNSFYILVVLGLLVSVAAFFVTPLLLSLLQVPDELFRDAVIYLQTSCFGIVFIGLYNGVAGILRALGDSKTPLYFLIFSSIMNVVLDLVFVLGLDMGVFGVALATVISQIVSAVTSMVYAYCTNPYFRLQKEEWKPDYKLLTGCVRLGIPVALQNSMIAVSLMALQGIVNQFGANVMAAFTVVSRIEQIVQQPYSSLGTAITNFSGQNMGAGNVERVKKGFRVSVLVILIFSLAMIPLAYIFGEDIVRLFVKNEPEVVRIGASAIRINSLCYFALGMIYVPRAVLNGTGDTGFAMLNGFVEVACRILYSVILTRIPVIGFWGIWITTGLTWVTTSIFCLIRYLGGKWKKKGIVKNPGAGAPINELPGKHKYKLRNCQ